MKTLIFAVFTASLMAGLAIGQTTVLDDTFGDGDPETNTDGTVAAGIDGTHTAWTPNASSVVTESGGSLQLNPSAAGDWARAEYASNHDFPLPTAGNSRTFNWTIGPVEPCDGVFCTADRPGDEYRIQLSAVTAGREQKDAAGLARTNERWVLDGTVSGASSISLDMFFERENSGAVDANGAPIGFADGRVLSGLWEKDSTHAGAETIFVPDPVNPGAFIEKNGNGVQLSAIYDPAEPDKNFTIGDADLPGNVSTWDWWADPNTFSLELTDTGYTWSDSVTGFLFERDYTAQTLADFSSQGYWAHSMGQNTPGGGGRHEISQFTITDTDAVVPLACDSDSDGDCDLVDIDALYAVFGAAGANGQFDFDSDGDVDTDDINAWLTAASVPGNSALVDPANDQLVLGDIDLDGDVNSVDLGLLLNNFNSTSGVGWGGGDLDGDQNVNSTDLGVLLNNFGSTSAVAVSAVPEPSSAAMLLVALSCIATLRRRQSV